MKRVLSLFAWVASFSVAAVGCSDSEDACEQACQRLEECSPGSQCTISGECSGSNKQLADCINSSPCDQTAQCLFGGSGGGGSGGSSATGGSGGVIPSGLCEQLAAKCPKCTLPNLRLTCEAAAATGDPSSCQDGLTDPDVQANCI